MKKWIKLWTEITRDPQMGRLTWAQRGMWMYLLALAGDIDVRAENGDETGAVGNIESIAWWLRAPESEIRETVQAMLDEGMVHFEDDVLYITHYAERQARAPSQTPEAIKERVRKWRAAQGELPAPAGDKLAEFAAALADYGVTVNTDAQAATWQRLLKKAGSELFEEAMQEAASNTATTVTPGYVEKIIESCQREGRKPGEWKGNGNGAKAEPAPPAPVRWRNPLTEQEEGV